MYPELDLGPISLQTFGICFALGFVAAGAVLSRRLRELDLPPDWSYEIVFSALIGGLVGARIDYLIQNWDKVSDDLLGACSRARAWCGSAAWWAARSGWSCGRGGAAG